MHYSVCDYLMDVYQNSIEAGADLVKLNIREEVEPGRLELSVTDNGCGMNAETIRKALDPFYTDGKKHPGRKVGLGLPFLKQVLESTDGDFSLTSEAGKGTEVICSFNTEHVDTPPLGDLAGTLMAVFSYPGEYELELERSLGDLHYRVCRSELLEALGDFDSPDTLSLLNQFLESQEDFHGETDS